MPREPETGIFLFSTLFISSSYSSTLPSSYSSPQVRYYFIILVPLGQIILHHTRPNDMTRQHLHFFKNRHLGNFPKTQAFGKFPSYPGIQEISQIPSQMGNSPNARVSQIPGYLRNFPDGAFGKFLFLTFLIIAADNSSSFSSHCVRKYLIILVPLGQVIHHHTRPNRSDTY